MAYPFLKQSPTCSLQNPPNAGENTEDTGKDMAPGEHRDGVDESCGSGRCMVRQYRLIREKSPGTWDANDHVYREQEMEACEEEVEVYEGKVDRISLWRIDSRMALGRS